MSSRNDFFSQLQQNLSDLIASSPAADLEKNMKAFMGQAFTRMDLLTRDEFDTQITILERALARISALEQRVQDLETQLATTATTAPARTAANPVTAVVETQPIVSESNNEPKIT